MITVDWKGTGKGGSIRQTDKETETGKGRTRVTVALITVMMMMMMWGINAFGCRAWGQTVTKS